MTVQSLRYSDSLRRRVPRPPRPNHRRAASENSSPFAVSRELSPPFPPPSFFVHLVTRSPCSSFRGGRPSIGALAGMTNCATRFPRLEYITITTPRLQRQHAAEVIKGGKNTLLLPDKNENENPTLAFPLIPFVAKGQKESPPLAACMHAAQHPTPSSSPIPSRYPFSNPVRALVPRWYCQQPSHAANTIPSKPPRATPNHSAPALACALSRTA